MAINLVSLVLPDFGVSKEQPTIDSKIYFERIRKLKTDLKNNKMESAIIYADREHFANMHYLTGFDPRFEEALLIINAKEDCSYLITGPENQGYSNISKINMIKKKLILFRKKKVSALESSFFMKNLKKLGYSSKSKIFK